MTDGASLYRKMSRGHGAPPPAVSSGDPVVPARLALLDLLPSTMYDLRGTNTQCYTIGTVAKVLGKKPVTIRSWEQKGWMPKPRARTAPPVRLALKDKDVKGRRLYSRAQVEFLINAYESSKLDDIKHADWDHFRSQLRNYPQP